LRISAADSLTLKGTFLCSVTAFDVCDSILV
jgi:hypothetical protein